MSLIGLDPTSGPMPESVRCARRRGRRRSRARSSGIVSNGLGESDTHPAGRLPRARRRSVGPRDAVFVRKPSVSVPPDPMDWEKLISQVTVAVAGFGG